MSLIMLHLSSRQLYIWPPPNIVKTLFTTAAGADWEAGGGVCFDCPSCWRSGKSGLGFDGRLRGWQKIPSIEEREKNAKISRSSVSSLLFSTSCTSHAERLHQKLLEGLCDVFIGGVDLSET
jgi:hypothetical protein